MKKMSNKVFQVFAWLWAVITLYPLIVTVFCSFKENNDIYGSMFALPKNWHFSNYKDALFSANMLRAIGNSLFLALGTTILVVVVALLASYTFARMKYKFLTPCFMLFMLGVMIPIHTTIIPISKIAADIGGYDRYWMLILTYTTFQLPQAIFLITGYIKGISKELDEAAVIDGCNMVQILFKIILPISKPIIATVSIISFVYAYSELVFSVILLSSPAKYPVSRSLMYFKGDFSVRMGPIFASIVLAVLPLTVIYLLFHEKVQEGMLAGSVKG
ncbi:carbohydrate ABC transporter permease [Faecalicatena sp. AGMB00832]|uniref:Carbohydrate ABC transporter permease n=1 Tax=Faecalicatena faecalis TaxID=2726362 RepID=A0ABS6D0A9_9FIRM|nr:MULTISPECIES: carbohydrate ABC transporter permease [Faecalicatena]MBU3874662.1 carbohydrate ABC transporter permease [Faecalicatena faecalis]MCI6464859.1 carbohydrate ABC transporter permease [Faecalicatena sp.]MDY5619939.1 carbohydrate ABC transporter permease [Lachnospiraceae bacterium]